MKKNLPVIYLFLSGIFISSLILSPFILDFTLHTRFIALALFMLATIYLVKRTNAVYTINADLVLSSYLAYVLFSAVSFLWAQNKAEAAFEISRLVLSFFVFAFTFFALKKQEGHFMEKLLKLSVFIFLIVFIAGCYQASGIKHLDKESIYNVTGLNGHKNLYASFLFLSLFFLINGARQLTGEWKTMALICILLNLIMLALLRTKAVWLGTGVSLAIYLILSLYKKINFKLSFYVALIILMVAANVFFLFVLQPVISKSIADTTQVKAGNEKGDLLTAESERLVLWDKSYYIFKKDPLLGTGAGNWQVHFPDATLTGLYRAEDLNYTFQRPHNDFLWILCETGILGLNLFLLFLASVILLLIKTLKIAPASISTEIILCAAFIIGYYVISFFDFPKERIEHLTWINMILGISYCHIKKYAPVKSFGSFSPGRIYTPSLIILLLILISGVMRYKGEYYTRKMYDSKGKGQPAAALKAGKAAWSVFYTLDPTSVPLQWYTGNANATLGNYIDAQKDFLNAYQANPYNRNVLNDLASAYVFNKDIVTAKKYYEEAARISPRFDDPKLNLAAVYIGESNYAAASACLNSLFHNSEKRTQYQQLIERRQAQ